MADPQPTPTPRRRRVQAGRVELDRHVDAVTAEQVRVWSAAWQTAADDLARAAAQLEAGDRTRAAGHRAARLEASVAVLGAQLRELGTRQGVRVGELVAPAVQIPLQVQAELFTASGLAFNLPAERELANITQRTAQQVASRYKVLTATAEEELRRAMVRGIAAGEGPRAAARELVRATESASAAQLGAIQRDRAGAVIVQEVRGAFAGGLARANNLMRTELLDASRMATQQVYDANAGLVGGWRWLSTTDGRTCPACWGMHNSVHPASELLEGHQQCRCAPSPILAGDDELDPDTGRPLDDLGDPDELFSQLPEDEQLRVLGPTRLERWQQGVPLRSMAQRQERRGWRPANYVTPVRDLPDPPSSGRRPTPPARPPAPPPIPLTPHAAAAAPAARQLDPLAAVELATMNDDDLAALMLRDDVVVDERAVQRISDELDARDAAAAAAPEVRDTAAIIATGARNDAEQAAVQAFYAAMHHADDAAKAAGAKLPDPPKRRTLTQQKREEWELQQHASYLQAVEAVNAHLFSRAGKRAGVSDMELWTLPAEKAAQYASEELRRFWLENPGSRVTWEQFRAPGSRRAQRSTAALQEALAVDRDPNTGRPTRRARSR